MGAQPYPRFIFSLCYTGLLEPLSIAEKDCFVIAFQQRIQSSICGWVKYEVASCEVAFLARLPIPMLLILLITVLQPLLALIATGKQVVKNELMGRQRMSALEECFAYRSGLGQDARLEQTNPVTFLPADNRICGVDPRSFVPPRFLQTSENNVTTKKVSSGLRISESIGFQYASTTLLSNFVETMACLQKPTPQGTLSEEPAFPRIFQGECYKTVSASRYR